MWYAVVIIRRFCMRKFCFLIMSLLLFDFTRNEAFAQACAGSAKQIENLARSYMKVKKLIHEGDEQDFPDLGVKIGWELIKVTPLKTGCAAVMAVCNSTASGKSCEEGPIEVLGLVENKGVTSVVPFEALYPAPKKVIAKIGSKDSRCKNGAKGCKKSSVRNCRDGKQGFVLPFVTRT